MDNENNKDIKDVSWQQVTNDCSMFSAQAEIKFRNKKFEAKVKKIMKFAIFILIAALSGGVTAAFIIDIKYSDALYPHLPFVINQVTAIRNSDTTRSPLSRVADIVEPALVGVSINEAGFSGGAGQNSICGIVFDSAGYIVTDYHDIEGYKSVYVKLPNKPKVVQAAVIGSNPIADLAVIKVSLQGLQTANFGDSSKLQAGDTVLAVGNASGANEGVMTAGIVCSTNKKYPIGKNKYKLIQTDAKITAENGGGFLCNEDGQVIAINLRKNNGYEVQQYQDDTAYGLAINEARDIIKTIMDSNKISTNSNPNIVAPKVDFGIQVGNNDSQDKNSIKGVYVKELIPGGSAYKAGIKLLDIIIELDKEKVTSSDDFFNILSKHKPGDTISCKVLRDGRQIQLSVVLDEAK